MYSTTYPPGQISLLGQKKLETNRYPHISYVSPDGVKFYLAGPLAPTPGAQNGLTALSVKGLAPPFQHLDNQGARQDGVTWYDALYDVGEYDFQFEASGVTTADTRATIRSWIGAWDPKRRGRLHVFTPEMGEWWSQVRPLKQFDDPLMHSYEQYGKQRFTWAARNDDAFWQSFDSVAQFGMNLTTASDTFTVDGPTLGSNWIQTYTGDPTGGVCGISNGVAAWQPAGNVVRSVVNRFHTDSVTDSQVVSCTFQAPPGFNFTTGVFNDIWARLGADTAGGANGIRMRIGTRTMELSTFVDGQQQILWSTFLLIPPLWNEQFALLVGTSNGVRQYKLQRDGFTLATVNESGAASGLGPEFRGWGFGMQTGPGPIPFLTGEALPAPIVEWHAGDNNTVTQSGFMHLINRGDQEAWPRYLCYGPGTFTFSDGPAPSAAKVTFGPILEDQVVLVTTLPRLRGVVDLSATAPAAQALTQFQDIIAGLVSFATANNVPPLLQQFESEFGIAPPQGVLYSLLQGRFTIPIPAKVEHLPPQDYQIAVSVVDGNAATKIVGAVTPLRQWPL